MNALCQKLLQRETLESAPLRILHLRRQALNSRLGRRNNAPLQARRQHHSATESIEPMYLSNRPCNSTRDGFLCNAVEEFRFVF